MTRWQSEKGVGLFFFFHLADCIDCSRILDCLLQQYILSSGCRSGLIHHSDVRVARHLVSVSEGHTQEVCGLAWSHEGRMLASGGNDNLLNVWAAADAGICYSREEPTFSFT